MMLVGEILSEFSSANSDKFVAEDVSHRKLLINMILMVFAEVVM